MLHGRATRTAREIKCSLRSAIYMFECSRRRDVYHNAAQTKSLKGTKASKEEEGSTDSTPKTEKTYIHKHKRTKQAPLTVHTIRDAQLWCIATALVRRGATHAYCPRRLPSIIVHEGFYPAQHTRVHEYTTMVSSAFKSLLWTSPFTYTNQGGIRIKQDQGKEKCLTKFPQNRIPTTTELLHSLVHCARRVTAGIRVK